MSDPSAAPPFDAPELVPTGDGDLELRADPSPPAADGGSLGSRVGRVAVASGAALVVGELITLGQTVALARLLTPAQVGLFAAGGVLTTFVTNFVEGGLRSGLVHRDRNLDDAAATVFWVTLASGALMSLLALAAAPVIGRVFDSSGAALVAAAMSGSLLLFALTNVPEALLQRQFSVRRRLIVGPSVSVAYAAVAVATAAMGFGVWSMVLGSYASSVVWVLTLWWICDWRPWRGRPSYRMWRELAQYGFPLVLGMVGDRTQKAVQAVVTGRMLGARDLGLQRYGERIARIPVMALVEGSSMSLFPAFTRLSVDPSRFRAAYLRALRLSFVAAAAMSALLVAVGVPLVVLVLGERWRGAGYVLVAMTGLGLGKAAITVGEEAIKGAGRTRLLNWYTLTETVLSVVLLLTLIRPLGLIGVGLSISLTGMITGIVVAALAGPVVGVPARRALGTSVPVIASAALAGGAAAALEHLVLHSDSHGGWGLGYLVLDGLVFFLVYGIALRLFAPTSFEDVGALSAALLRRAPLRSRGKRQGVPS